MDKTTYTFKDVEEGMPVYDSKGDRVGTVSFLHYGQEDAASTQGADYQVNPVLEEVAEALTAANNIPEELRERLQREGYLRIDSGILQSDAFVMEDQIARVDEHVHLTTTKDKLIYR